MGMKETLLGKTPLGQTVRIGGAVVAALAINNASNESQNAVMREQYHALETQAAILQTQVSRSSTLDAVILDSQAFLQKQKEEYETQQAKVDALNTRMSSSPTATPTLAVEKSDQAPTLTLVSTKRHSSTPTRTPTQSPTPSATKNMSELLRSEKGISPLNRDETLSMNASSYSLVSENFSANLGTLVDLRNTYGSEVDTLVPLLSVINDRVSDAVPVYLGLNNPKINRLKPETMRLNFSALPEKEADKTSIFEKKTVTFKLDNGETTVGFAQNPAEQNWRNVLSKGTDGLYRGSILVENANGVGPAYFALIVSSVQRYMSAHPEVSLTPEQVNQIASRVTQDIQKKEWTPLSGFQTIMRQYGQEDSSVKTDALIPVLGTNGKSVKVMQFNDQTCRVQMAPDFMGGDRSKQKPEAKNVIIKPQEGLTKYSQLDAHSPNRVLIAVDQVKIDATSLTKNADIVSILVKAIEANINPLTVYSDISRMEQIPSGVSGYEVAPESTYKELIEVWYKLCGQGLIFDSTPKPTRTPFGPTITPGGPTETPQDRTKTPTAPPTVTPVATNNPETAPTIVHTPSGNPTDQPTVVPTNVPSESNPGTDPQPTVVTTSVFGN